MNNRHNLLFFRYITISSIISFCLCQNYLYGQESAFPFKAGGTYKVKIQNTGLYELTYRDLAPVIENIDGLNPTLLQLWSTEDSMLQIPIKIKGESDGSFDINDQLYFWVEGPNFKLSGYESNPYDSSKSYFLTIGDRPGARIEKISNSNNQSHQLTSTSVELIYDSDLYNLLDIDINNSGSGQEWVGREITNNQSTDIKSLLKYDLKNPSELRIEVSLIVRSDLTEQIMIQLGNEEYNLSANKVDLGDVEDIFGRKAKLIQTLNPRTHLSPEWKINYVKNSPNARVWIDQIKITATDEIEDDGASNLTLLLSDDKDAKIVIDNPAINEVWAINSTDDLKELRIESDNAESYVNINEPKAILTFDNSKVHSKPTLITPVEIPDLSKAADIEMVILYHKLWQGQAERLAEHRNRVSGVNTIAINIEDVYNFFSSGSNTPDAIRRYAQLLDESSNNFKYLLLFGDGSFDYRNISDAPFQNFIPTYETQESLDPLLSFPTDDYFALLDEENPSTLRGDLDIAVGRIPVRTNAEAEAVVSKLIHYDTHPSTFGSWKNNIAFLADDEDFNLHVNDAEKIADRTKEKYKEYNQEKIYWDAFPQVSTPGGNRYPAANEKLNTIIDQGVLVMNYLGHGGPIGWSQERVLNITDIDSWSNFNRLPLIITATCSFTGFDDPNITSAGEASLFNPAGGAIGLFTTVRSVYASKNFRLTQAVFDTIFSLYEGENMAIGEILRRAKNVNISDNTNARKFLLIGDPSMKLAIPPLGIKTVGLKNKLENDTIGALDEVFIRGEVVDQNGVLQADFNGSIEIIVYDKERQISTLQNDSRSLEKKFDIQNNIIYKGVAKVENGSFDDSFIVPVDIDYSSGNGRISYYALSQDNDIDAHGTYSDFVISGSSVDPVTDDDGPVINLYLNDRNFNSGDIVAPNPFLIADIEDDIGVNLSQTSIGHEIVAIIDGDTRNPIILNDFYTAGNNVSGSILYPISNLSLGEHNITVSAFDIANNRGETAIRFIVDQKNEETLNNFQVTPSLSSGELVEFAFLHQLGQESLIVEIEIYNMLGQLVYTIRQQQNSNNGRVENIYGDLSLLEDATYICRAIAIASDGRKSYSNMKKIQILK